MRSSSATVGVYPRVCGEAGGWFDVNKARKGLSPRVRGSLETHRREDDA